MVGRGLLIIIQWFTLGSKIRITNIRIKNNNTLEILFFFFKYNLNGYLKLNDLFVYYYFFFIRFQWKWLISSNMLLFLDFYCVLSLTTFPLFHVLRHHFWFYSSIIKIFLRIRKYKSIIILFWRFCKQFFENIKNCFVD